MKFNRKINELKTTVESGFSSLVHSSTSIFFKMHLVYSLLQPSIFKFKIV